MCLSGGVMSGSGKAAGRERQKVPAACAGSKVMRVASGAGGANRLRIVRAELHAQVQAAGAVRGRQKDQEGTGRGRPSATSLRTVASLFPPPEAFLVVGAACPSFRRVIRQGSAPRSSRVARGARSSGGSGQACRWWQSVRAGSGRCPQKGQRKVSQVPSSRGTQAWEGLGFSAGCVWRCGVSAVVWAAGAGSGEGPVGQVVQRV